MLTPQEITANMLANDAFSKWLGIEVIDINEGSCQLKMIIREDMLNGFGMAHGGITYSFADSAFAFASNSRGQKAVSIETSISHTVSLKIGDEIIAYASEEHCSNKIAVYTVKVYKALDNTIVAMFKGTVYRTSKSW